MPVKVGATYRHSKRGTCYLVQSVGTLEATGKPHVVYRALTDGQVWIRPVKEWDEPIEFRVEGGQQTHVVPRFEQVSP